jgi:hypothetical protein
MIATVFNFVVCIPLKVYILNAIIISLHNNGRTENEGV